MNVQSAIDMLLRLNSPNAEIFDEYDFPLVGAVISDEGKVELEFEIPDEARHDEEDEY